MLRKLYIPVLLLISLVTYTQAQDSFRSNPPQPGPAPEIQIGDYESFTLDNGLQVIIVANDKLPRISYQLILDVPTHKEGEYAGLSSMAGQMLRTGTTNRTKAQLDQEIDFIGASLSTSGSGVFGSSLTKHKATLLDLMADVLYNPAFPQEEFDKIKQQNLSELAQNKENPEYIASNVGQVMAYGKDHPYGELETEQTIGNITVDKTREYYETYFKPNIATLVIVGDITVEEAKKDAQVYFADWERGELLEKTFAKPEPPQATEVNFVDKKGAVQSVINITYPIYLKPGDDGFIAANVMNHILGAGGFSGRLFQNLREDKGFTYGANSRLITNEEVGRFVAFASVRNAVTDSAVTEFMYEIKRMRDEPISEDELQQAKNFLSGSFARGLESPQQIAQFAFNTFLYDLPEDYYANYLKNLNALTVSDIQEVARRFMKPDNAHIVVVGKKGEVSDKLSPFGPVTFHDIYGNPVESKSVSADVTPKVVIDRYLEAIGGVDKLKAINSVVTEMSTEIQGMTMQMTNQVANGKMALAVKMDGNVMQNVKFDGEKAQVSAMGQNQTQEGEEAASYKMQAYPFPEMYYEEWGLSPQLDGIEPVDGQDAYVLSMTLPDGSEMTEYYAVESGLKLKAVTTTTVQGQTINQSAAYADYQEVDGIKFPFLITQSGAMPMAIDMKVDSIELNADIPASTFAIEE